MLEKTRYRYPLFTRHLPLQAIRGLLLSTCVITLFACSKHSSNPSQAVKFKDSPERENGTEINDLPEVCMKLLQQEHDQAEGHESLDPKKKEELKQALKARRFAFNKIQSNPGSKAALSQLCSQLQAHQGDRS